MDLRVALWRLALEGQEEKDIDRIVALLKVIANEHHKGRPDLFREGRKKYSAHEVRDILYEEDRAVFVAVDENDYVLGYLFSYIIDQRTASLLETLKHCILTICVSMKISEILESARSFPQCRFARECGCYNIELNVWSFNDRAIEFYKNRAWKYSATKWNTGYKGALQCRRASLSIYNFSYAVDG